MVTEIKPTGTFLSIPSPDSITIFWRFNEVGFRSGSLDCIRRFDSTKGEWYISRAFIKRTEDRGKGIGSEMMCMLKEHVANQGGEFITVHPGGYEENKRKQFNFYRKNGFVNGRDKGELLYQIS